MLSSHQKKKLRAMAHHLEPYVIVGQNDLSNSVLQSINQALLDHELIKVKFMGSKDKESKTQFCQKIEETQSCDCAGLIGHVGIFYRPHPKKEKRKIKL